MDQGQETNIKMHPLMIDMNVDLKKDLEEVLLLLELNWIDLGHPRTTEDRHQTFRVHVIRVHIQTTTNSMMNEGDVHMIGFLHQDIEMIDDHSDILMIESHHHLDGKEVHHQETLTRTVIYHQGTWMTEAHQDRWIGALLDTKMVSGTIWDLHIIQVIGIIIIILLLMIFNFAIMMTGEGTMEATEEEVTGDKTIEVEMIEMIEKEDDPDGLMTENLGTGSPIH